MRMAIICFIFLFMNTFENVNNSVNVTVGKWNDADRVK